MNAPSRVERLGTENIGKLLLEMSSQTTLSLLVYAIYSVTDTSFLSVDINSALRRRGLDHLSSIAGPRGRCHHGGGWRRIGGFEGARRGEN